LPDWELSEEQGLYREPMSAVQQRPRARYGTGMRDAVCPRSPSWWLQPSAMTTKILKDVFIHRLSDIHIAERQLTKSL